MTDNPVSLPGGRRIFFLKPNKTLTERLMPVFIDLEYEIYTLKLSKGQAGVFINFPESLLYINAEEGIFFPESGLPKRLEEAHVYYGFYGPEDESKSHYCCPLDYISFNKPVEEIQKQYLTTFDKYSARGQRRYVRFGSQEENLAPFIFTFKGNPYAGVVHDISSAGISFSLSENSELPLQTRITGFKIEASSNSLTISGTVSIKRQYHGQNIHVLMLDRGAVKESEKLRFFVHQSLQRQMEEKIRQFLLEHQ